MYYKISFEAVSISFVNCDNYTNGNLKMKAKTNSNNIQKLNNEKEDSNVEVFHSSLMNSILLSWVFSDPERLETVLQKLMLLVMNDHFFLCYMF